MHVPLLSCTIMFNGSDNWSCAGLTGLTGFISQSEAGPCVLKFNVQTPAAKRCAHSARVAYERIKLKKTLQWAQRCSPSCQDESAMRLQMKGLASLWELH